MGTAQRKLIQGKEQGNNVVDHAQSILKLSSQIH